MKSKILNSKAYQVFDYICRLVILNVLLVVCSFSIFIIISSIFKDLSQIIQLILFIPSALTFYPGLVAIVYVIKGYETGEYSGVFKEYFRGFKKYYFKTLLLSILLIATAILLVNSFNYFNQYKTTGLAYLMGFILTLSFGLMFIMLFLHLPLVIVYFDDLGIVHYIKLSVIFAFRDFGLTIILTLIVVASLILSYFFSIYMLIIGFSLPIYFIVKFTKKKYLIISERNNK